MLAQVHFLLQENQARLARWRHCRGPPRGQCPTMPSPLSRHSILKRTPSANHTKRKPTLTHACFCCVFHSRCLENFYKGPFSGFILKFRLGAPQRTDTLLLRGTHTVNFRDGTCFAVTPSSTTSFFFQIACVILCSNDVPHNRKPLTAVFFVLFIVVALRWNNSGGNIPNWNPKSMKRVYLWRYGLDVVGHLCGIA